MVTAYPVQRWSASHLLGHLVLGGAAVAIFLALQMTTGLIEIGGGTGWDGADYGQMMRAGWSGGTVHTRLRPLVIWLNAPLYALLDEPVHTFAIMNVVYTGLFALVLSMLLQRYGATLAVRAVAVVCIVLTNHFRLFAFYPVLVDLGACLALTVALLLILEGPRWAAAVACIAAVLAREYAVVVLCFGMHRDLRRGVALWSTVATFAPAAIAWLVLRLLVMRTSDIPEFGSMGWVPQMLANVRLLKDPLFVALFIYGVITVAGGLSIVLTAQLRRCWSLITREPEWVSYTAPVLVMTALGKADLWRYLTPLLPVVAVFYAHLSLDLPRRRWLVLSAAAIVLTVWTQEPFSRMDAVRYFADWFPYYVGTPQYPLDHQPSIWPAWGWRFLIVTLALGALMIYGDGRDPERLGDAMIDANGT